MRIILFANNWVGWKVTEWLAHRCEQDDRSHEIVGLFVHPEERRKYGKEIMRSSGLGESQVFDGSRLESAEGVRTIAELKPDIGVSALFGYILRKNVLDLLPEGCVNIHPAFLPYNRGAYPNVWSIIEGTPAGATILYMDQGIDTGDIIDQRVVAVEPVDTGETLYTKLEHTCLELFKETWPRIVSGQANRIAQRKEEGTSHRVRDAERVDEIDLDRLYTGRELIDIIRARSSSRYPGAYFQHNSQKVYMRLQLVTEDGFEQASVGDPALVNRDQEPSSVGG